MTITQSAGAATLEQRLLTGIEQAGTLGRRVVVGFSEPVSSTDPVSFFAAGRQARETTMLWERPDTQRALVGIGITHELHVQGAGQASIVAPLWQDLLVGVEVDGREWGTGPMLLGGFAFQEGEDTPLWRDYPPGLMVLPRHLLAARQGVSRLTSFVLVGPGDSAVELSMTLRDERDRLLRLAARNVPFPSCSGHVHSSDLSSSEDWRLAVQQIADAARSHRVEKAVLARAIRVTVPEDSGDLAVSALQRLRAKYPACTVFALARGESCFLGATPERLVSLRHGEVRASSLAGSRPRGATELEDARLGTELMASHKERAEHEIVAKMLVKTLQENCDEVHAPETPQLLPLHNVQHLYTPVVARARRGQSVLHLVERLHPTPAVGGSPHAAALELIQQHERLDRGWYAGPLGWVDSGGEGEFVVAIRSALVRANEAVLYAGCGIVADSDPESEYQESELKLRAMLGALGGGGE